MVLLNHDSLHLLTGLQDSIDSIRLNIEHMFDEEDLRKVCLKDIYLEKNPVISILLHI